MEKVNTCDVGGGGGLLCLEMRGERTEGVKEGEGESD